MLETGYMRPLKAALLAESLGRYEDLSGRLGVARHKNVTLVPLGQLPGVAPESGLLIDDCDFCSSISPDAASSHRRFSGVSVYGGYLRKEWGHFLMNSTARLWACFSTYGYERIVFFASCPEMMTLRDNYREFFELSGLLGKVVIIDSEASFEHLLVPDISLEGGRIISREFLVPFAKAAESALARPCDAAASAGRLLLARSRWRDNDKIQINCGMIERIFESAGYTPVNPESLSLSELIRSMHNAREIASFSGSTAHNLLFCRPGVRFISIERAAANNLYQTAILRLLSPSAVMIDAFYQPLLISSTDNLTIYGLTPEFTRFIRDLGWPSAARSSSPAREFRAYLRVARRNYGYAPGLNEWESQELPAIVEAYHASRGRYAPWLGRRRPVLWSDYLSVRVIKRLLCDLIRKRKEGTT